MLLGGSLELSYPEADTNMEIWRKDAVSRINAYKNYATSVTIAVLKATGYSFKKDLELFGDIIGRHVIIIDNSQI